ncbi:Cation/H(+) antiporter 4 [Linum grandiflorum]
MNTSEIIWKHKTVCYDFPPKLSTEGISYEHPNVVDNLLSASLPLLNIQIFLIVTISNALNYFLKRLRIPTLVGQALTGVILGPTLLGRTEFFKRKLFPQSSQYNLEVVAYIGLSTIIFFIGVKMELTTVINSGKKVLSIGITSMMLPMIVGLAVQGQRISTNDHFVVTQIFGVTGFHAVTTIAAVSQLLDELRLTNSEIGRIVKRVPAALVVVHSDGYCDSETDIECRPPLGSSLVETLEPIVQNVMFPVYVAMTVMKADLSNVFTQYEDRDHFIAIIYWTALLKFSACLLLSRRWMPVLDSIVLALIINVKGIVDMTMFAHMRDYQVILPEVFSLFILAMIVFHATVIPILVSFLYEPSRRYASYHSKNISEMKPFSELRILTCIHKPHHVVSMMKLFDTLCQTEDSAVALYVIHLLKQIGHAAPVFMCHQKQRKSTPPTTMDSSMPSIEVVFAFTQYERKNIGLTSVESFTSISQYKLMQEDIFTLALDKLVSLILVPFHRQWSMDGTIETEDSALKALNMRILNTAPCSVGILYDRRRRRLKTHDSSVSERHSYGDASSSTSVCMIYLGGRDDKEALSLAKRMADDPRIHLTIMHMAVDEEAHGVDIEGNAVLRKVLQETANHPNVQFLEKTVNDGNQTARLVSAIASQYDLFVIGRRSDVDMDSPQTEGLANWSEFPELGVIGDLLAAKDVYTSGSVFPTKLCVQHHLDDLLSASLPLLNIQILLIYVVSSSLNCLLKRLRIPSFVSQALTGVILGPTLLGRTEFFKNKLFPKSSQYNLEVIAFIGYSTFMFLVGVKMDVSMVFSSGKKVLTIGVASLIFPLVVGIAAQQTKIRSAKSEFVVKQICTITEIQSLTTFAVVAQLLDDLRLTNSEIGRLSLSSALVAGTFGLVLHLGTLALASELDIQNRLLDGGGVVVSILTAWFVLRPAVVTLVIKKTPAGERVSPAWVVTVMAVATAYLVFFDARRQSYALGPFFFGLLVVPPGPPLGSSLVQTLEPLPQAVFFPVFVAMTVMKADLNEVFSDFHDRAYFVALIFWTTILRFSVCLLLALRWIPILDSIFILPQLFSLFILAIMVNATVIPLLVSFLYHPTRRYASYHSRNIFALRPFTELRILTCIHKPHHVLSVTNLLDTLCRTEESMVALYVIHLLEQIGQAAPVFICHQRQKKPACSAVSDYSSTSIDVVFAFAQYERKNIGFTSLESFTSISQYKYMQEDIFTLVLDKLVSLILVPFHRKWSIDGRVESEDSALRALNNRILDTAPCSVGILYDRGHLKAHVDGILSDDTFSEASSLSSSCSVCMIYIGGRDDQEAISLAKRMANDPSIHLTILHIVSEDEHESQGAKASIGNVVLRGVVLETVDHLNVQYVEKVVKDGTETTKLVSSIAGQYDLFVVGKRSDVDMDSRQTAGLAEWSEFPELGVVGDLLASKEVQTRGSVLVVQQQKRLK